MKASSDREFARFKNADFAAAKPVANTPHLRKLQAQAGGKSRVTLSEMLDKSVRKTIGDAFSRTSGSRS